MQVIYLDELRDLTNQSIALGTLTLVVESPKQASVKARTKLLTTKLIPGKFDQIYLVFPLSLLS
ncbi:DUF2887 domain-containing protein [Anabaena sp. CS-542/02]|uniref:DUF2887 domain-containing protein n=1 Tax=Anabaena sp. CS-542/02 TaxID=3021719 RepID=UPI0023304E26|nr:DUF2887 domain-containing protein [Anabaena sp. CS-542/02]MDB9446073.1 DUF2887 domain-containing protein [Anabaena sp. CS-542/02]